MWLSATGNDNLEKESGKQIPSLCNSYASDPGRFHKTRQSQTHLSFCLLAVFISGMWMRKPDPTATRLIFEHCGTEGDSSGIGLPRAQCRAATWAQHCIKTHPAAVSTRARFRFHSTVDGTCPCFHFQVHCCVVLSAFPHSVKLMFFFWTRQEPDFHHFVH